jgi:predicted benzoate:H+ symporter BenE
MSAQIIQLSDHRKARPPLVPGLMSLSLALFGTYLVIGAAINEAIIDAAKISLKNET